MVPSQFFLLKDEINTSSIKKIYFSGEALTKEIVDSLTNKEIYNYYGPTETGEITLHQTKDSLEASIIGKIFANSKYYILDTNLNPVPKGVVGELYISGVGLA